MTNPITPPLELLRELSSQFHNGETLEATWAIAFQAGADHELAACCEWVTMETPASEVHLRAARRPKPPSLKEQALEALVSINSNFHVYGDDIDTIRRALEALPE
jgi:hypothetical protein